ncbi:relaxase/mobilization nuclease domain-containing protein [Hyphomonas atlantica corrig.]|uniref:relaxase/mobilization nuclease domain-containing protein n=1 Tax=Hyphomonas atlantica TaxID=1280948 RepID=UPI002352D473|nr:relaxase/mobilization nuclease domain-containing protein [Hyphomonas atlantica]
MILHGNARGGGRELAIHLMRTDENEHVQVHDVEGFMADDVRGAFQEIEALAKGTRCQKPLFSLSLSPPKDANASSKDFEKAIAKAEDALGLSGQPRVIVFHEKGEHRDRHCHVVWSRIDAETMRAIPMPFNRLKMRDVSRELFIEHGWDVPRGLINKVERNPLNYTLEQYQQAKRTGRRADEIKADMQAAWAMSDTRAAFEHALQDKGFRLARGDRRGFVVIDHQGEVMSLPRWLGVKTKMVRERLGPEKDLPDVESAQAQYARDMAEKMGGFAQELRTRNAARLTERSVQKQALIERQRAERDETLQRIEQRRIEEVRARQAKFPNGLLKRAWSWLNGETARIKRENEAEAAKAQMRDEAEKHDLIQRQREQRLFFQRRMEERREKLSQQRQEVSRDRADFEARANLSREERKQAFMDRRQAASGQRRGPEPER